MSPCNNYYFWHLEVGWSDATTLCHHIPLSRGKCICQKMCCPKNEHFGRCYDSLLHSASYVIKGSTALSQTSFGWCKGQNKSQRGLFLSLWSKSGLLNKGERIWVKQSSAVRVVAIEWDFVKQKGPGLGPNRSLCGPDSFHRVWGSRCLWQQYSPPPGLLPLLSCAAGGDGTLKQFARLRDNYWHRCSCVNMGSSLHSSYSNGCAWRGLLSTQASRIMGLGRGHVCPGLRGQKQPQRLFLLCLSLSLFFRISS